MTEASCYYPGVHLQKYDTRVLSCITPFSSCLQYGAARLHFPHFLLLSCPSEILKYTEL